MKYLVILCDGMADRPLSELDGKTPLQYANTPNFDKLSAKSTVGLIQSVDLDLKPGSDVANLSILGYDPKIYYTGRSPLEAGSIGIDMKDTDISLRTNLMTVSDAEEYENKTMIDYSAGDIHTADAKILIDYIQEKLGDNEFKFYSGVAYRHCLIWDKGTLDVGTLTPPHDITDQKVKLSNHPNAVKLIDLMKKSYDLLSVHPINVQRVKNGLRPANSIWLWGEGKKAALDDFKEKYGLKGSMISAVDLLKGIAKFANMSVVNVDGATGYIDTDFDGKVSAAISEFERGNDLVYVHIEAPDECSHRGEIENKVKSLELIDKKILEPMLNYLNGKDYKILITADHATPLCLKTHSHDPVPFMIYNSTAMHDGVTLFNEVTAAGTGIKIEPGYTTMKKFIDIF